MNIKAVATENAPKAIGPYSQAMTHQGVAYVSGQIALDPKTMKISASTVEEQRHQVMKNLGAILEAAGSGYSKIIKTTILLSDMADFAKVNEIYATYLSQPFPARATFQVAGLPMNVKIEIDAIAAIDS